MAAIRGMSLKNVLKIRGSFCPFDPKTSTIREFLRRVNSKNMIETNAKCQITVDVKNDKSKPFIEVTFESTLDGICNMRRGLRHAGYCMGIRIFFKCSFPNTNARGRLNNHWTVMTITGIIKNGLNPVDKDVQVYNTENLKLMDLIAQFNLKCREKTK